MNVDIKIVVAALEAAIDDQQQYVDDLEEDYEAGYHDGLIRALDIVQLKARGLLTGAETT